MRRIICDVLVQMPRALRHLTLALALALVACQTQSFRSGQSARVQFGTVRQVEQVSLQSDAGAGALIGGTIGLMAGGRPRNAMMGAAAGGIGTAAAQGDRTGFAYTVGMLDGSVVRIVSDQREIRVGDCVAIERVGQTNNIRRESSDRCAGTNQASRSVQREAQAAAARCESAKEELVRASNPEEVDAATRKVGVLCND